VSKKSKQKHGENERTLEELMQGMMDENVDGRTTDSSSPDPKGKVSYAVASAASALHQGQALGAGCLIVDPPRKGLEEEVLAQLCKPHNPKQAYAEDPMFLDGPKYSTNWVNDVHTLVYVSCGFDALARDCDRLLKGNAGWKLESATGYVLFPGSNHLETVAVFKRRAGREDTGRF
jgi:23S rRNA (uracil1939-C5)-methyltransferase